MKSIQILVLTLLIISFSCTKESNGNLPDGIRDINVPLITKEAGSNTNIDFTNAGSFAGKVIADIYFKNGPKPEKADIVAIKNGVKTTIKVLQANITSFPSTLTVNKSSLETAFGQPLKLGDSYSVGMDIYHGGVKYEAFPVTGIAYAPGVLNLSGASTVLKYDVVCPFNIDNFVGDFEVTADEWEDYPIGTVIKVAKVSATSVSFSYNCGSSALPIVLTINAATGAVSGPKSQYCSYNLPPVLKFFGDVVEGARSYVDNCSKTIYVRIAHTDELNRNFGEGNIILKRK
ncbi:MAG: hypothetical protein WAT37_13135 [Saprospiraceae bacterium]